MASISSDSSRATTAQKIAQVDENTTITEDKVDPFDFTREAFLSGLAEYGQHFNLDEKEQIQLWFSISNGKLTLSKEDFQYSDLQWASQEFSSKNLAIMTTFSKVMELITQKEDLQ